MGAGLQTCVDIIIVLVGIFFFFKQKTAYEIYQCDWSSDVCSSDLEKFVELLDMLAANAGRG